MQKGIKKAGDEIVTNYPGFVMKPGNKFHLAYHQGTPYYTLKSSTGNFSEGLFLWDHGGIVLL